ncbi:hypothetical protein BN1723_016985 [Verticillium longisporum]|uniref:Peptide hydrolase n=2 Tax=Verticillium longisporum TaxID=100787 RepID=A0A0G4NRQ0_VERLO|nr:hypothetical protein BN1723_016985 [Verticillium longisporum]
MPRKDGYQACREIREWEVNNRLARMPIIALSANVMSDVQDKCVAAGFSDYVTKPVDFISLSRAMSNSGRASVASTESGNTIRGGMTPGYVAATPSYPFPRMTTPGMGPGFMHHPFANLSPSTLHFMSQTMSFDHFAHDKVLSNSSTPASTMTFHPSGATHQQDYGDYPTPHLYDLSLMLGAEPGLEAWWGTVVQILRDVYKAERVTLAVPADSTDIENVPWGQKATYNEHEEDELSLGYMARGSSLVPSSADELSQATPASNDSLRPQSPARPGLHSRHSFTSYENIRDPAAAGAAPQPPSRRPSHLFRSQSYFPPGRTPDDFQHGTNNPTLNQASLAEHNAEDEQAPGWEEPAGYPKDGKGRVLPMLQALDFEADPLIDHSGITRVLERGKVIALTRSYPYLQNLPPEAPAAKPGDPSPGSAKAPEAAAKKKRPKRPLGESSTTKLSMLLGGAAHLGAEKAPPSSKISRLDQESPKPPTPQYEEYEQAPPSPWSQSPAPSPAIRSDTKENPFFADAMVDEDSFNPTSAPQDYTAMPPPEAIGVENSWTVLHIPLTHLLLSEPHRPFKLDNAALEHKSHNRAHGIGKVEGQPPTPDGARRKSKSTPIAILSILTPVLPYPSNLRHSLEHLAPHMATSFSLARHYTNLETELAGMQRRRPATAGFGAIHSDGRPLMNPSNMASFNFMSSEDIAMPNSLADSLTSPSDYSGLSKSATGSPSGTPNWDQSSLGMVMDARTGSSPAQMAGDSYFSTRTKSNLSKAESTSKSSMPRSRSGSKDSPPLEKRLVRQPSGKIAPQDSTPRPEAHAREAASEGQASRKGSLADEEAAGVPEARPMKTPEANQSRHTLLHSYGADFATSFQSLPPSSSVVSKPAAYNPPSRGASISSGPVDMPPPSDRLKGLMLDALPAHVFVSLPQSGEVVWVNSRYLTYRGQTVADLAADPWGSIHPEDRDDYLKAWGHSLRTGEQFSRTVRIKRFDGAYRWFYARAVASRDKRGVLMQFLGSYMDIHDQHIAELKAARQEEIETSEAKHRLLANLIPQIIFTATEDEGITFANDQWLSYTGQSFTDCLGLGFMDFVHPEDLAKCQIPTDRPPTPMPHKGHFSKMSWGEPPLDSPHRTQTTPATDSNIRGVHQALSRNNSSSSSSVYELPTADLTELARKGIIKVSTDSNGRLSYTTEVRLRSKKGAYRWHLIRCVEIDNIDFGSGASSFFGSATDINDHKLLEAKLKEAMESKSRIDRNRSTAQRMVESQKASYEEIGKRMGNKGYKVLLVEDNSVNQKVLQKYLKKVGVEVEVAADGVECTDMVLARGHEYYSLILDYYIYGISYSPSTPKEGITSEIVLGPAGAAGCDAKNYEGLDVKGKIVLTQRFRCPTGGTLAGRVRPAAAAGAAGVIIYHDIETLPTAGSLGEVNMSAYVSTGFIRKADGEALVARIQAGEKVVGFFQHDQLVEERITQNVFVETEEGDPHNVIVLGAHLDSVQAGPGINDDASGSSLILEVFKALQKYRFKNKVRFAWWGAEENGLLGSRFYTQSLEAAEVDDILAYLNFDMVSKGYFGVSDNDGSTHGSVAPRGSETIEAIYVDWFESQGHVVTPAVLTNGSDYASFWQVLGKPFGFLNTGTGVAQDPCYHQACDTIDNPDRETITVNAKAAAHMLSILALNGTEIIPKQTVNATMLNDLRARHVGPEVIDIAELEALGERHLGCGHDL